MQYGFEALMANEFYDLPIQCVPPNLVPLGPGTSSQYQGCTIQGSQPGQTVVPGAEYISVAFQYSRSHLWRNFGFICAFFLFFVFLTAVGMEVQKPNKGGGSVTIYKRGQVPNAVAKAMEGGEEPNDIEKSRSNACTVNHVHDSEKGKAESTGSESGEPVQGVHKNETIFTWQNVSYTIPYQGGERQLLNNVQGYVRPGKLTALMGASG